jgi:hypothetical protein
VFKFCFVYFQGFVVPDVLQILFSALNRPRAWSKLIRSAFGLRRNTISLTLDVVDMPNTMPEQESLLGLVYFTVIQWFSAFCASAQKVELYEIIEGGLELSNMLECF